MLTDPQFADAVLITTFNDTVHSFGQQRALNFAHHAQAQAFWIHATDAPPESYTDGYPKEYLQNKVKSWLTLHSKWTGGILSLLLCCYDMPFRVTDSGGKDFKKYGVHSGSRCKLKAWDLSDADKAMLQNITKAIVILQDMPKVLLVPWCTWCTTMHAESRTDRFNRKGEHFHPRAHENKTCSRRHLIGLPQLRRPLRSCVWRV